MQKTALITGCSEGGIGDAIAQEFHERGVRVFATARNLDKISHLKDMGMDILQLDVESPSSIQVAVTTVTAATAGKLDFLVNNSGRGYTSPLLDTDVEVAREILELNVISVVRVTQQFSSALIAAQGKIINIGSIGGKVVTPYTGIYAASKAALHSLSDTMRVELAPFGVQVITVIAGTVNSGFYLNQPKFQLPKGSVYASVIDNINETLAGYKLGKGATRPRDFACGVVSNAMQNNSILCFWYGTKSSIVWFITTFFPHTFLDRYVSRESGLLDKMTTRKPATA